MSEIDKGDTPKNISNVSDVNSQEPKESEEEEKKVQGNANQPKLMNNVKFSMLNTFKLFENQMSDSEDEDEDGDGDENKNENELLKENGRDLPTVTSEASDLNFDSVKSTEDQKNSTKATSKEPLTDEAKKSWASKKLKDIKKYSILFKKNSENGI